MQCLITLNKTNNMNKETIINIFKEKGFKVKPHKEYTIFTRQFGSQTHNKEEIRFHNDKDLIKNYKEVLFYL